MVPLDFLQGKIIAHRGLSCSGFVENSKISIINCIKNNIPIEIDLQYHPSGDFFVSSPLLLRKSYLKSSKSTVKNDFMLIFAT